MERLPLQKIDVDAALRTILEGTATKTGAEFFRALVKNLELALNTMALGSPNISPKPAA